MFKQLTQTFNIGKLTNVAKRNKVYLTFLRNTEHTRNNVCDTSIRQMMAIRTCHHLSNRELLITQLYRELGEHHLRDDITVHSCLLEKIRDLELANKNEEKKNKDLDLQLELYMNNK